jgi:hypothetical protein
MGPSFLPEGREGFLREKCTSSLWSKIVPRGNKKPFRFWASTTQDFHSQIRIPKVLLLWNELTKPPNPDILQSATCSTQNGKKKTWPQDNQTCRFPTCRDLSSDGRDNCYNRLAAIAQLWLLGAPKLNVGGITLKCSFPICSKASTCWETWPLASGRPHPLQLWLSGASRIRIPASNYTSWCPGDVSCKMIFFLEILDFYTHSVENNPSEFLPQVGDIFDGTG